MDIKIIFLILLLIALGFGVYTVRKAKLLTNLFLLGFTVLFILLLIEFFTGIFGGKNISSVQYVLNWNDSAGTKEIKTGSEILDRDIVNKKINQVIGPPGL